MQSFHALTPNEKLLSAALSIKIIQANQATHYHELAESSPLLQMPEATLRLLNGQYPDGRPKPQQLLKVIQ